MSNTDMTVMNQQPQQQIPINRIFCAFPIFCPSENMYQRNLRSVISFVEYVKLNPHLLTGEKGFILDIFYGGFSAKQIWFDTIKAYIKNNLEELVDGNGKSNNFVKVFQYDKNYGKAKVVNDLFAEYLIDKKDTQFVFTMDSDMVMLKDQIHFFDRLFLAAKCLEEIHLKQTGQKKSFGMVALNQSDACYHWFDPKPEHNAKGMDQKIEYELGGQDGSLKMKEELVWPSDGMGLAGGGIFFNAKLFHFLGGYQVGNHEYFGEDGMISQAIQRSNASVCIIKTLFLQHPQPSDDEQYLKWKADCMKEVWNPFDENKYQENLNKEKSWIEK